ncbi:Ankyrin repeat protein 1 [Giardia muris]|uniref:Ankyrin repeat protein 1 n=1 Tax=Giardia muris TaxID=5742 RepID=A0A4Z1SR53_GIAMU|nr:Ankyrin repeat protein 1 [Giardia muris]|eukprot:TNJ28374.1 Ankyrin repeat protein 1 [Giardia muris]
MTALMLATTKRSPRLVELLKDHEQGRYNAEGKTALMIASERGYYEIAKLLDAEGQELEQESPIDVLKGKVQTHKEKLRQKEAEASDLAHLLDNANQALEMIDDPEGLMKQVLTLQAENSTLRNTLRARESDILHLKSLAAGKENEFQELKGMLTVQAKELQDIKETIFDPGRTDQVGPTSGTSALASMRLGRAESKIFCLPCRHLVCCSEENKSLRESVCPTCKASIYKFYVTMPDREKFEVE